jgi:hypothetical protein
MYYVVHTAQSSSALSLLKPHTSCMPVDSDSAQGQVCLAKQQICCWCLGDLSAESLVLVAHAALCDAACSCYTVNDSSASFGLLKQLLPASKLCTRQAAVVFKQMDSV